MKHQGFHTVNLYYRPYSRVVDRMEVFMKKEITYYETTKEDHTLETFALVKQRIEETGINKIILASTTGRTALRAMEYFADKDITLIVIPHQYGFSSETNLFPSDTVKTLREHGHEVHFGTMLFHTEKLYGSTVPAIIADFLRCLSEGVKVCYEITLMASDGGYVNSGEAVIAIAGTGVNADTALLLQASTTRNIRKLRINEIICKPYNSL